LSNEEGTNHQ
jgi:hypothetical protein